MVERVPADQNGNEQQKEGKRGIVEHVCTVTVGVSGEVVKCPWRLLRWTGGGGSLSALINGLLLAGCSLFLSIQPSTPKVESHAGQLHAE